MRLLLVGLALLATGVASSADAGAQSSAIVEQPAPDWRSAGNAYSLSYRRFGWDLVSNVRPAHADERYALYITSTDKQILCNLLDTALPGRFSQDALNERTRRSLMSYEPGSLMQNKFDRLRVLHRETRMAGGVAVHRATLETLDPQNPMALREQVRFALSGQEGYRLVSLNCLVGRGVPAQFRNEVVSVIETLQIGGKPMEPRRP